MLEETYSDMTRQHNEYKPYSPYNQLSQMKTLTERAKFKPQVYFRQTLRLPWC